MARFESIKMEQLNGRTTLTPIIIFSFSEVFRSGLIKSSKEYTLVYDKVNKTWTGDVIEFGEWRTLTSQEVSSIMEYRNLERMI